MDSPPTIGTTGRMCSPPKSSVEQDAVQKIARADLCFDNHAGIFKISLNLGKIIGCTQSWVAKIKDGMKVSQDIQPNGGA